MRALITGFTCFLTLPLLASEEDPTLADLAAQADLIAIVRVEETDYTKTRDFPSEGSAVLKVLIPYRGSLKDDLIEVEEEGLEDAACYYPEVGPFEFEGQRFLVMLRKTPDKEIYRGRAPGCRIPILVTQESQYFARYPIDGLRLPAELAQEVVYSDPAAYIDASELTFAQAREMEESGIARREVDDNPLSPDPDRLVYTRGIPIWELRGLMELDRSRDD